MKIKKFVKERKLASAFIIISITILALISWFASEIKSKQELWLSTKFRSNAAIIERTVTDLVHHTEFIVNLVNEKIKQSPNDKNYIYSIISNYKVNPDIVNTIPWTYFDWVDKNQQIVVNAAYGVLTEPIDVSQRDYVQASKKLPNVFHISKPVMGKTSKRWIIVEGIGLTDKSGVYIGTNALGYDLNSMGIQLKALKKDENVIFYLFDKDMNLLIDSSKAQQDDLNATPPDVRKILLNYVKQGKVKPDMHINVIGGENSYLLKKFDELPFYIYISYDHEVIKEEFWKEVTSRLIELVCIGMVGMLVTLYIYRRESFLRRKAEDSYQMALSASKGKSEFLAYTGHELRSPLNVIIFGSEMMKSKVFGELPPKYLEYAEDIYQNGNDLLHFIEDLLDVTKADEEGKFSLSPEFVDINDVIDRVIKLNFARATKHKVRLEKLVSPDLPRLWGDSRRLRQVLNNLVSNAVKYSPENTRVRIVAHAIDGFMQIVVEDEGFGMTPAQLEVAMSRYGTIENDNSDKVESIGLGLPLVKQLVDAHKGKFEVESAPNKGTTVTLTFKLGEQRL